MMPVISRPASAAAETRRHRQRCRHCAGISAEGNAAGKAGVRLAAAATVQNWKFSGMISRRRIADE